MAVEAGGLTNSPMLEQVFVNPDHSSQVLYQLSELWRDKKLCDATIEVGPVKVYVHRLVLLAACPYLLTVGGQHEVSILEVKLPMTVGLEGLNIFLTYLYDGVLHLTTANLRSVEKLAKILKVASIQKFCQEFRDANRETGAADKLTTDYSLKMTNSSLQIIFAEIQTGELKRESADLESDVVPIKRPRMNLDMLSAALQKKSSQSVPSDSFRDTNRGHSGVGATDELFHTDRHRGEGDSTIDTVTGLVRVKDEPVSDYEEEDDEDDDAGYGDEDSELQGYGTTTTDFVRQAPYDTRPFPDDGMNTSGSKMVVSLPPPPSLQKRPGRKRKQLPSGAQHTAQTSTSDADVSFTKGADASETEEGSVDATKVLKNIVKAMPEMAMNLGTSSEIGDDNKPRMFLRLNEDQAPGPSSASLSRPSNQTSHNHETNRDSPEAIWFESVSGDDSKQCMNQDQKDTTRRNTRWAVKILQEWHVENFLSLIDMCAVTPTELSQKLLKFYLEAKPKAKKSGEKHEYHQNTLINIRAGINRHLLDLGREIDVVNNRLFYRANKCLDGMIKERLRIGTAQPTAHKEIIEMSDLEKISAYFSQADMYPVRLRHCVWFNLSVHFVTRGLDFHNQLCLDSFQFHKDSDGVEFVMLTPGGSMVDESVVDKRMYATGQPTCPVHLLRLLIARTEARGHSLFNHFMKDALMEPSLRAFWYTSRPLSKRTFGTFMHDICQAANCSKRYTPQCLRATVIQVLNEAGFSTNKSGPQAATSRRLNRNSSVYHRTVSETLAAALCSSVGGQTESQPLSTMTLPHVPATETELP